MCLILSCLHANLLQCSFINVISHFLKVLPNCCLRHDALQCKKQYCDCMSSVHPSVCLSVTLVDQHHIHAGWKSWKLITPSIAQHLSPKAIHLFPAKHGEILGRLEVEVGWGKVACWSTKVAISLKGVTIDEKLLWRAYRNSPTLFRTVPSTTPNGVPFPKIGGSQPQPKTAITVISGNG